MGRVKPPDNFPREYCGVSFSTNIERPTAVTGPAKSVGPAAGPLAVRTLLCADDAIVRAALKAVFYHESKGDNHVGRPLRLESVLALVIQSLKAVITLPKLTCCKEVISV